MRKTIAVPAVLLATAALSGCGTYTNLVGGPEYFDGNTVVGCSRSMADD
jgi:hypothetical protein